MNHTLSEKASSFVRASVQLGAPLVLLLLLGAPSSPAAEKNHRHSIVGTWLVTATADDPTKLPPGFPPQFEGVETFNSDGTMQVVTNLPGATIGAGVWEKAGPDRFTFTFSFYRLDTSTGNPFGTLMLGAYVMENVLLTNGGKNYITTDAIVPLLSNLTDNQGDYAHPFTGTVKAKRYEFGSFNQVLPQEP